MALHSVDDETFDPAELRDWEKDPRGERFWLELRKRGNAMMTAVRRSVAGNDLTGAAIYEGNLQAFEETLQLVDLIVREHREAQEDEETKKETE